jgi:hypothetical protein
MSNGISTVAPPKELVMGHLIASDLSQQVLEMRRLRGELGSSAFDSSHRHIHKVSGYRAFIPDVEDTGDRLRPNADVAAAVGGGDESDIE